MQPDHQSQSLAWYITVPQSIYPSKQCEQRGTMFRILSTGTYYCPLSMSQKGTLAKELQLPTFGWYLLSCRTICKPRPPLVFLCQLIIGNSPWGHRCTLEETKQCSRSGEHGIWATSSCNLLVPSGPAQTWSSCLYRFHLMIVHAQFYGLVGQITLRSRWEAQVTGKLGGRWWRVWSLWRPSSKPRTVSLATEDGRNLLQNSKDLHCDSPKEAC